MGTPTKAQERVKSAEEIELEKQAAIAKLKNDIAQSELNTVKAKKESGGVLTDKEQAEVDKAIAEANKATIQAKRDAFKGPEIAPLSGKVTSEGSFIEVKVLAQSTLLASMKSLSTKLQANAAFNNKKPVFIIYNSADLQGIELYAAIRDQVKSMENAFTLSNKAAKDLLDKKPNFSSPPVTLGDPLIAGYAVSGILRTAADIASLFKTNNDFKNADISVDETDLVASFKISIPSDWKVFNPSVYPINTVKSSASISKFVEALNDVQKQVAVSDLRLADIDTKTKELATLLAAEKDPVKISNIKSFMDSFTPISTELKSLKSAFQTLQTTLSTADQATKITAQSVIMRAERLYSKLLEADVYVIKFHVTSKGSTKINESIWRSAKIEHSAGTELSCLVFGTDGEILFSESLHAYEPYKKSSDIK
jgi:hypothetical protein